MSGIAGTIKTIIGQVFAIAPDGSRRLLVEGDKIQTGEQIETGANGAVTLTLSNGKTLDLGRDSHWEGEHNLSPTPSSTDQTDIAAIQQAIADGQDQHNFWKPPPLARNPQPGAANPALVARTRTLSST